MDEVMAKRGGTGETVGFITGDSTSRQFQIFKTSGNAAFWAICIGTRNIEGRTRKLRRARYPGHADHRRRLERT